MSAWTSVLGRWFAAFNAHDVRALLEHAHPRVVAIPAVHALSVAPGTLFRGHEGLTSLILPGYRRWPGLRVEPGVVQDLGSVALVEIKYVLDNGVERPERRKGVVVFTMEDELIIGIRGYENEAEARADLERDPRWLLTPRQRKILALLADGLTADEVAHELVLSPSTVRTHITKLKDRLGARNIGHAIAISLRGGGGGGSGF